MSSRLSKIFSRSSAETKRGNRSDSSSPPPPSYRERPSGYDREDAIDPPDLTAGFNNLDLLATKAQDLPTVDEAIAHLKLLECFFRLSQSIGTTKDAFLIRNDRLPEFGQNAEFLAKIAEKRWAVYVARAADRFAGWMSAIAPPDKIPTLASYETDGENQSYTKPAFSKHEPLVINSTNLPPVDVLMVWHAYMLNPRAYLEDCIRGGRMHLWQTPFPWAAVVDHIDSETFKYDVPDAQAYWRELTRSEWDNLNDKRMKKVTCPVCNENNLVSWTSCDLAQWDALFDATAGEDAASVAIDKILQKGTGFCENGFFQNCSHCGISMSHDSLRAAKFRRDIHRLIRDDKPMPGTILSTLGVAIQPAPCQQANSQKKAFQATHKLLTAGLGLRILQEPKSLGTARSCTVNGIRGLMQEHMADRTYMRLVKKKGTRYGLAKEERILFRKMMSRYWENSSL